jgi:electron transport complex protein RnfG
MLGRSITRNSFLLAVFAVLTTLLISGTYLLTRERIAEQQRKAEEKALLEIIPRELHDNVMLDDTLPVTPGAGLGLRQDKRIYLARRDGEVTSAIVPVTAKDGYSGDIDLIVGVNRDGSIAGVRTLNHRETPGLGDKVDLKKSDWILDFKGRSLDDPGPEGWAVTKDGGVFDQFTGATITPRAVVAAVHRALQYVRAENRALFNDGGRTEETGEQ